MKRPLSKFERRGIILEFKERKPSRGIFAIRCSDPERVWVGSTMNLRASRNTIGMLVEHYARYDEAFREQLRAHGAADFRYEVLEEVDPELSELSVRDILKGKKLVWAARLGARVIG